MTLLQELLAEGKRSNAKLPPKGKKIGAKSDSRDETSKARNFVAKNSQSKSGAGAHTPKKGEKAPRNRQKSSWKKDAARDM